MSARPAARASAGFSLLEVIIGFVVMGVVFAGLTGFTGAQRNTLEKSRERVEAAQATLNAMDRVKLPVSQDTAAFRRRWVELGVRPRVSTLTFLIQNKSYTCRMVETRVSGTDRLIKYSARTTWGTMDTLTLGGMVAKP